ncbi:PAS domain-containing protein [Uliginosibacterium sp. 31-16]|uniref:PAS domain-containing protein n=1 Tax=Uliginosibacterium sp. 31-16 TaxID=3068315 RepID=UPI00273E47C1|nr:PAS domain-containing protein [Uliginosibacterium sp. 31-16]MDP5240376.1 PAS domain-containing protein [Uliginosibacterium sp. 31-16]
MPSRFLLLSLLLALISAEPANAGAAGELLVDGDPHILVAAGLLLFVALVWRLWRCKQADAAQQAALDVVGLALMTLNDVQQIRSLSSAFRALVGIPADVHSLRDFPPAWKGWLESHAHQALKHGKSTPEERLFAPAEDAPAMLLRLSATRLRDAYGKSGVLLWCENLAASNESVSAALEHEHTLRTRSQRFIQTLIDVIPRPVYVKDDTGRYTLANESFCAAHGISRDKLLGHRADEVGLSSLNAQTIALEDARVMAGAPIFKEEFTASPEKPGEDRYIIVSKQSCVDPEGRRVLVGTHIDITPWRLAERDLQAALRRETEKHHRTLTFVQRLLDVFPNPVCLKDANSRYVMVNEAFVQSRGKSREELLNHDAAQIAQAVVSLSSGLLPEAERRASRSLQEDQAVLAGTPLRKEENNSPDQNGVLHDRIVTKTACEDPDGHPIIVVSMFDITDMRNAQRELDRALQRESRQMEHMREFLQRVIDMIPQELCIKDADSRILLVNPVYLRHRHLHDAAEVIGRTAPEIGDAHLDLDPWLREHPADLAQAKAALQQRWAEARAEDLEALAGKAVVKEVRRRRPGDAEDHSVVIAKTACTDMSGRQVIVCVSHDLTEMNEVLNLPRHGSSAP